jgi:hypothetical protein
MALVVAWPIDDEANLFVVRLSICTGFEASENVTKGLHELEIGSFGIASMLQVSPGRPTSKAC